MQFGERNLPADADRTVIDPFLKPWVERYGDRDTGQAARGYDTLMVVAKAATAANTTAGPALRDAVQALGEYRGAGATYDFSASQHVGITKNPYYMARFAGGQPTPVK